MYVSNCMTWVPFKEQRAVFCSQLHLRNLTHFNGVAQLSEIYPLYLTSGLQYFRKVCYKGYCKYANILEKLQLQVELPPVKHT